MRARPGERERRPRAPAPAAPPPRRARLHQVARILRKSEGLRSAEELAALVRMDAEVREVCGRLERRRREADRARETEDDARLLGDKCDQLAEALRQAQHLVVYTGAGISTSADIPDYRGPNGIWTRLQQGKHIGKHDLSKAVPTYTHMALRELHARRLLKFVVSQNCDGLHLRSGLPRRALAEVHGNMYIEVCASCKPAAVYWRLFDTTERTARFAHKTLRICHYCGEPLTDSIVHFGERGKAAWPLNWAGALRNAAAADVILCLGSSLKVLRRYPWLWAMDRPPARRPKLFIVNLQWTPKDEAAALKINGRCDTVMRLLMERLGVSVPPYERRRDPIFSHATLLSPRELHTTTRPMLMRDSTHAPTPTHTDSEDDTPLHLLRHRIKSEPRNKQLILEPELKSERDQAEWPESGEPGGLPPAALETMQPCAGEPHVCEVLHQFHVNMRTDRHETHPVSILLLSKHSPTKPELSSCLNTPPSEHSAPSPEPPALPPEHPAPPPMPPEPPDLETILKLNIVPKVSYAGAREKLLPECNGLANCNSKLEQLDMIKTPTTKPKLLDSLRNFRRNKDLSRSALAVNGLVNYISSNGPKPDSPPPGHCVLRHLDISNSVNKLNVNGIVKYQIEPMDLSRVAGDEENMTKVTKYEEHKKLVHEEMKPQSTFNCAISEEAGASEQASLVSECQALARAIIQHTVLVCRAETRLLYSGLHSIITPAIAPRYLQYDFVFDAVSLMRYGRRLLGKRAPAQSPSPPSPLTQSPDRTGAATIPASSHKRARRRPPRRRRRSPACRYCHTHYGVYSCAFYAPHGSDERVEKRVKSKLMMCDCCGHSDSSGGEEGEEYEEGSEAPREPCAGWYGKGYRKGRRRPRR